MGLNIRGKIPGGEALDLEKKEESETRDQRKHTGFVRSPVRVTDQQSLQRPAMGDADRLPMANVSRIVQSSLPKDAVIAKEARVALSACATVFVHYITEL